MAEASDLEPLEWLARLGTKLRNRATLLALWERYYDGDHDLPAGPNQHKEAYRRFQRMARTNLCRLCAESAVHRTNAIGFRDSQWSGSGLDPVWRLWQNAKMDARQFSIWRKAYSLGAAYAVVGVRSAGDKNPQVTIESPHNMIVESDPADATRRLAALRLWHDDIVGRWMATLYLRGSTDTAAGTRYHWQSVQTSRKQRGSLSFKPGSWEQRGEPGIDLPGVPVIPFYNADEGQEPVAEFDAGSDIQSRLNLTLLNRLSSERYAAFRQSILFNYIPEEDPVTGQKIAPWEPGVTQIGTIPPPEPGDPAPQLVQLQQTSTGEMLRGIESDMRAFAAVTITPVYYLPGDMVNLSADAIGALDSGHNSKITQRMGYWGEGLEEMLAYMADIADLGRDLSQSEIVWARPENFIPSQTGDFLSKMVSAGVPLAMAMEEVGWSPQRISRLRAERMSETMSQLLTTKASPVQVSPVRTQSSLPTVEDNSGGDQL